MGMSGVTVWLGVHQGPLKMQDLKMQDQMSGGKMQDLKMQELLGMRRTF